MSVDNTDVKYTLILEGIDRLENGMKSAKHHTDALGESMHHLKETALELVGAYVGFEVLKESLGEWELHQKAVAKLSQMYDNNKDSLHENLAELKEIAEKQENLTGIHTENTMAAEANLMKYRDLKVSYEELIPVAADFAKVQGVDIAEAANLMGRALSHPEQAMRLLRQAGISLNKQQLETIAKMEHAGKGAEVQAKLMELLKDKFQGTAKAMFDADPSAQLEIGFKQVKESIGELLEKGLVAILPYLKAFMEGVKTVFEYLKEHTGLLKVIGVGIMSIGTAMAFTSLRTAFLATEFGGLAASSGILAAAETSLESIQLSLNAAMLANPIGILVGALAALVTGCYAAIEAHQELLEEYDKSTNKLERNAQEEQLKALYDQTKQLQEKYHLTEKVAKAEALAYQQQAAHQEVLNAQHEVALALAEKEKHKYDLFNGKSAEEYANAMQNLSVAQARASALTGKGVFKGMESAKGGKGAKEALIPESQSDKVSGTKQVIINVSINKLVELIKIEAQNIKEGASSAASDVAKALLGAVDQFSASADI